MKYSLLTTLLMVLTPCWLIAKSTYFTPNRLGVSATSFSQGSGSLLTSAACLFENPASIATDHQWQSSAFHTQLLGELTYQNIAVATIRDRWWVGLGGIRLSTEGIPLTKETQVGTSVEVIQVGEYSYRNEMMTLGGGWKLSPHVSIGGAIHGYRTQLYRSLGQGFNASLGGYYTHPYHGFRAGLTIHNLLPFLPVRFNEGQTENLPLRVQLSAEKNWGLMAITLTTTTSASMPRPLGAIGLAYRPPWIDQVLVGRASYREIEVATSFEGVWVIGLDLTLADIGIQYAWEISQAPDSYGHHIVSFTLAIGRKKQPLTYGHTMYLRKENV